MNLSLDEIRIMCRQWRDEGMTCLQISCALTRFNWDLPPKWVEGLLWGES